MRNKIFISYVRQDKERVEAIYDKLAEAGFKPWMDTRDVLGGQLWRPSIEQAIRNADYFLACISRRSVSKRGFLQKEIRDALSLWNEKLPDDIFLIPVRLESCKVPEGLSQFQWIDLFEAKGWGQLMKALEVGSSPRKLSGGGQERKKKPGIAAVPAPAQPERPAGGPVHDLEAGALSRPVKPELPVVTFPEDLRGLIEDYAPEAWHGLSEPLRRFVVTLGTKLEPIIQIVRPTPVPVVIGFESLAIGSLGENFRQIRSQLPGFDPGLLRLLLMLTAMKTASLLRVSAAEAGNAGARHLLFTINLDPETLNCPFLTGFLKRYQHYWERNVLFEVNEQTTLRSLKRLKLLQSDFDLRYCADDFNNWRPEVKIALRERVEMTKLDFRGFQQAMAIRGDDPDEAIERIAMNLIPGKPLVVEGVEDENHLLFLEGRWPFEKHGDLFGQGYYIEPGYPWEEWTSDLRVFGFPGGHILTGVDAPAKGDRVARRRDRLARAVRPAAYPARSGSRTRVRRSPAARPSPAERIM